MSAQPASESLRMSEKEFLAHYADGQPSYEFVNGGVAWLVLPTRRTVEVFDSAHDATPLAEGAVLSPAELPGFTLAVSDLFAVLD